MSELARTATDEIRAEMARQRLSQMQLAERCKRSQPWLSRRLAGEVPLTLDDLDVIAVALGVPAIRLLWPPASNGGS